MAISESSDIRSQPGVAGYNSTTGDGVWGQCDAGRGVVGVTNGGAGVWGHAISGRGVVGVNNEDGSGVWGETKKGRGVVGIVKTDGDGTWGECDSGRGVVGVSKTGSGVWGQTTSGRAVVGVNDEEGTGVWGETKQGRGVVGISHQDIGVFGKGGRLAAQFEGDVEVTGDIRLTNADCAEDFDIVGNETIEPGTVMVLGDEGTLHQSHQAYDKRVAGVISGAGDYKPGIVLDNQQSKTGRKPIALLGKVYCKVDARYGVIEVGDLLTTSETPGHAMKVIDPVSAFGAVIGKALRPLRDGQGLIPILIALQ